MERLLALAPRDADLHRGYGLHLFERNSFVLAARELKKADALGRGDADALFFLGSALLEVADFPGAEDAFRRAIALAPERIPPRHSLGRLLLLRGKPQAARDELQSAAKLAPASGPVRFDLGRAREAVGDLKGAEADYRDALRLEPGFTRTRYALGTLLARTGRQDEAKREIAIYQAAFEKQQAETRKERTRGAEIAKAAAPSSPRGKDTSRRTKAAALPKAAASTKDAGCAVVFTDVASAAGIRFTHERGGTPEHRLPETMGSGLAWLDFDGDGLLDLYVVQSGPFPESGSPKAADRLYRNLGNGTFADVTAKAGLNDTAYGMGAIAADYDNDGFPDLFVTNYGHDILYRNNGDGTFTDVTAKAGVAGSGWSTSAAFADFDGDGFLDLFVVRYVDDSVEKDLFCGDKEKGLREYCHPSLYPPVANLLFHNEGNGTFTDISVSSGIAAALGKGLGVVVTDIDDDGKPDVYVANDTTMNFLFRNLGGNKFEDVSLLSGAGINFAGRAMGGMGVNAGDLDGDGRQDLVVTNFEAELNGYYHNLGSGLFEDLAATSGFGGPSFNFSGFGLNLFDADDDGDLDAFVANGHVLEAPHGQGSTYAERPFLMWNDGKGKFHERGCGDPFRVPVVGRGSAAADYDNDGDVDVAVSSSGGMLQLLRNGGSAGGWIGFVLRGKTSNRQGVGARVTLETPMGRQVREVHAGDSYLSSSDPRVHFGLGDEKKVLRVTIRWPSGIVQEVTGVAPGRYHVVDEQPGKPENQPKP